MPGGGSRKPPTRETLEKREHFIRMRGRDVFRFAVTYMGEMVRQMIEGYDPHEVSLIVPHQVNKRIIEAALERMEIPSDKVIINIDEYGNTSAATVPIALDQALRAGRVEKGKLVILVASGAGFTWGGSLLRW